MTFKNLLDRQINVGSNLTSSYYSNKIIKNYYNSANYLYRYEVDLPLYDHNISNLNTDLISHISSIDYNDPVEDLSFSSEGNYMVLADERSILFCNLMESYSFPTLIKIKSECKGIYNLCFNNNSSKIIYTQSRWHENVCSLQIVDLLSTKIEKDMITEAKVKNLSVNPINPNVVLFSDFRKKLFTHDFRSSEMNQKKIKNFKFESYTTSLSYHPQDENLVLVSTNGENELFIFDLRNSQIVNTYKFPYYSYNAVENAYFNRKGTQILVSKTTAGPILFNLNECLPAFEFNEIGYYTNNHNNHHCFAGIDDEYIVSGSHNFDVFMWEIPKKNSTKNYEVLLKKVNKAKFVLKGHTALVNKVFYNHSKSILASIAWDKLIFWSCLPLYSESKKNEIVLEKHSSQEVDPKYLPYLENETINIIKFFYLEDDKLFITENQFYYGLKDISDLKPSNLEESFEKNLSIRFIYLFLIDFKIKRRFENSDLSKSLKDLLDNCSEDNFKGNKRKWNLLIECKKVFETKLVIMNCIEFLNFNIRLFIMTKEKLNLLNKLNKDELKKFESLGKLILIMKALIYDLIIVYKMSKELYEISYKVIKKFIERVGYECGEESTGFDFLRCIYKKDSDDNNDKKLENLKKILNLNTDESSRDESIDFQESISSFDVDESEDNEESQESSSSFDVNESENTIDSPESIVSFDIDKIQEIIDILENNLDSDEDKDEDETDSSYSNSDSTNSNFGVNLYNDFSSLTKKALGSTDHVLDGDNRLLADDLRFIYYYTFSEDSEESISKKMKIDDHDILNEKLKFCFKLNKKKSLKLFKQYDDNFLFKLSNDSEFEQKFKKEFSSLKKIELINLYNYYTNNSD